MSDPEGKDADLQAEVIRLRGLLEIATEAGNAAEAETERLTYELGHRVKNTLSMVQALAGQSMRHAATKEEALDSFGRRIIALGQANDVILKESWTSACIGPVIETVLSSFGMPGSRFSVGGPEIRIPAGGALSLAMAMHELGTNARRHGAWSGEAGRVEVLWRVEPEQNFSFAWTESGGPLVTPPETRRFGLKLAEQSLRNAFGRNVTISFEPTGFSCTARAPLAEIVA